MAQHCSQIIGEYICNSEQVLGQGLICTVYEAKKIKTNQYVALKQISKKSKHCKDLSADVLRKSYNTEIKILKYFKENHHKNIISLIGNFETSDHYYIILELCDSNLKEYLQKQQDKRLDEYHAIDILEQIVEGERSLHKQKYCHRDIKPENILLKNGIVKITDVNLSKNIEEMYQAQEHTNVGTPFYQAPELYPYNSFCPYKADIYSLGVVLYEMIYGLVNKPQTINFQNKIQESQIKVSKEIEELIIKMLEKDPQKRADWQDVSNVITEYKNSKITFLNLIINDFSQLLTLIQNIDTNTLLYPSGLLIIKFINKLIEDKTLELQNKKQYSSSNKMKQPQELRYYLQKTKIWYEIQTANNQVLCQSEDLKDEFRHKELNNKFNKHFQCYLATFFNQLNNLKFEQPNFKIKLLQLKIIIACDLINNLENVQQLLLNQNLDLYGQNILSYCQNLQDIQRIQQYINTLLPIINQILNDQ